MNARFQRGFSMLETVIGVSLLAIVGLCFASGLATIFVTNGVVNDQAVAAQIAQRQIEYARDLPYRVGPAEYPTVAVDNPFAVSCQAQSLFDTNLQRMTVTVSKNGQVLTTVQCYKVNR